MYDVAKYLKAVNELSQGRSYLAEYQYDRTQCTGECTDYCRCTHIINTRVTDVYMNSVVAEVIGKKKTKKPDVLQYAIDRILTIHKLWDASNWEVHISDGYYWEEVSGCSLDWQIASKVCDAIKRISKCSSDSEIIQLLLEQEYGYLLPGLKNKTWTIMLVSRDSIIAGQEGHYRKLDRTIVDRYKEYDYNLPICVCIQENGGYRLIDGYHRYAASTGQDKVYVIVGA